MVKYGDSPWVRTIRRKIHLRKFCDEIAKWSPPPSSPPPLRRTKSLDLSKMQVQKKGEAPPPRRHSTILATPYLRHHELHRHPVTKTVSIDHDYQRTVRTVVNRPRVMKVKDSDTEEEEDGVVERQHAVTAADSPISDIGVDDHYRDLVGGSD